jgi:hypothetical protein
VLGSAEGLRPAGRAGMQEVGAFLSDGVELADDVEAAAVPRPGVRDPTRSGRSALILSESDGGALTRQPRASCVAPHGRRAEGPSTLFTTVTTVVNNGRRPATRSRRERNKEQT